MNLGDKLAFSNGIVALSVGGRRSCAWSSAATRTR